MRNINLLFINKRFVCLWFACLYMIGSAFAGDSSDLKSLDGSFDKIEIVYLYSCVTAGRLPPEDLLKMFSYKLTIVRPPIKRLFVRNLVAAIKTNVVKDIASVGVDCRWGFLFNMEDGTTIQLFFDDTITYGTFQGNTFEASKAFRKWVSLNVLKNIFDTRTE